MSDIKPYTGTSKYVRIQERWTNKPEEVQSFVEGVQAMLTWELGGQPISLFYDDGNLVRANIISEGRSRDVTNRVKHLTGVPLHIPRDCQIEVIGKITINWKNYNLACCGGRVLPPGEYVRQLFRSDQVYKDKKIEFIAHYATGRIHFLRIEDLYRMLRRWGFKLMEERKIFKGVTAEKVENIRQLFTPFLCLYPATGLKFFAEQSHVQKIRRYYPGNCINLKWGYEAESREIVEALQKLASLKQG